MDASEPYLTGGSRCPLRLAPDRAGRKGYGRPARNEPTAFTKLHGRLVGREEAGKTDIGKPEVEAKTEAAKTVIHAAGTVTMGRAVILLTRVSEMYVLR